MILEERRYPPKLATPQPTSRTVRSLPPLFKMFFGKFSICRPEI
jgi:hypothetical protein